MIILRETKAGRRHFVGAALAIVLVVLGMVTARRPAAISEEETRSLLRIWLAANYDQSLEDPALRSAASPPHLESLAALSLNNLEVRRPWIKPTDVKRAALARAEVAINGVPLGDGNGCFLLVQSGDGAWTVRREISESAYRWRLGF
jgi:hypothetical protein